MGNIPHDAMHCSREIDFVLVIHCDADEELRFAHSASNILSQLITIRHELIWIACHSCVSHMSELSLVPSW